MPVRAVLLDAFGTIIHPEPGWEELREECLAIVHGTWNGQAIPLRRFLASYEKARAAQHEHVQDGLREFSFSERFANTLIGCGVPREEATPWGEVAHERYHRFQQALVHAYDQPARTLARLRADGYRVALVSNYAHTGVLRDALARLHLLPHFDALIVSADVGYMKPHPRMFQTAVATLGVTPEEAVMVGNDLECDIEGAKKAGLRAVWTPYPRVSPAPPHPSADAVLERLEDLPALLARW